MRRRRRRPGRPGLGYGVAQPDRPERKTSASSMAGRAAGSSVEPPLRAQNSLLRLDQIDPKVGPF